MFLFSEYNYTKYNCNRYKWVILETESDTKKEIDQIWRIGNIFFYFLFDEINKFYLATTTSTTSTTTTVLVIGEYLYTI